MKQKSSIVGFGNKVVPKVKIFIGIESNGVVFQNALLKHGKINQLFQKNDSLEKIVFQLNCLFLFIQLIFCEKETTYFIFYCLLWKHFGRIGTKCFAL